MASIRKVKLADGRTRWRIRVFAGRDPESAKRTYITKTFDRKKDADREANRLEGTKGMGMLVAPSREPFAIYLRHWLDNVKRGRGVRAGTLEDYRNMLRRYVFKPPEGAPPIGAIRLDRLAPPAFESLYAHLWDAGLAPRTLQYLHSTLRQALTHAVKTGAIVRNPTDGVRPPSQTLDGGTPERKIRAMTREESQAFLTEALDDRLAALWAVLLLGGLRPSEAFALMWEDVDLEGAKLRIRRALTRKGVPRLCRCGHEPNSHTDGGRGSCAHHECDGCKRFRRAGNWRLEEPKTEKARRAVDLADVAVSALRAHHVGQLKERLAAGPSYQSRGFVFATTIGTPLDLRNVYKRYQALLGKAKLGEFRLYDLRHTFATLLLLDGIHPKIVSEMLGHADVSLTLNTYSHVLPTMQRDAARRFDAMFGQLVTQA